jgi:hypothetical protein
MINVCLVGCGKISEKHILAIKKNSLKFKLIALCDKVKKKAKILAEKNKVNYYSNVHEMLRVEKVDIICILTANGEHFNNYFELKKYNKNFIIEKPLALKFSKALKIKNSIIKKNKKIFVVKQNRFNPAVIFLKKSIENKKLGKIFMGTARVRWRRDQKYFNSDSWRGTRKLDGGVIGNQACHHLDLLIWLLGPVKEVYANGVKALAKIESEDTIIANLKFYNGAIGVIEATTATSPKDLEGSISILGSEGTIILGGFAMNKIDYCGFSKTYNKINLNNYNRDLNKQSGHALFYKYVQKNINKNNVFLKELEIDIQVAKVIESINKSIVYNRIIKL